MKVLIICWNLYPEHAGGAAKSIYYTAKALSKLPQITATHVLTSTIKNTRLEKEGKLRIERHNDLDLKFRTGNKSFGLRDFKRKLQHIKIYKKWGDKIREKYNKFKPDIIHCNDPFVLRRVLETLGQIDIPIVVSVRGYWACSGYDGSMLDKKGKMVERWGLKDTLKAQGIKAPYSICGLNKNKRNLRKVKGIHFISKYIKNKTEEHVRLSSIRKVIMNPRPIQEIKNNAKRDPNQIAYIGELTYKKGLHKLLEALKILVDEGKKYKLVIAGVGPLENKFKKFVDKNKLNDYVSFMGWVGEPNKIYEKSTITVVPSLWPDPLPGVAFEPMFNNSIPLVSKYGGMPEIVPFQELTFDPENSKELAEKIKDIMEDPKKQKEIRGSFKDWLKQFYPEVAAKQFLSFYEEVINQNKKDIKSKIKGI